MSQNKPYPGFPPTYQSVPVYGGFHRDVLVVDILSTEGLSEIERASLKEQIEALVMKNRNSMSIQKATVASKENFDHVLARALRL